MLDFIQVLDGTHYGSFVDKVLNDISKRAIKYTKSPHKVFVMVNTRVLVSRSGHKNNATIATISEITQSDRRSESRDKLNGELAA